LFSIGERSFRWEFPERTTGKRVSTLPKTAEIPEELSPKSVLKRQENDVPLEESNGGYQVRGKEDIKKKL